MNSAVLAPTVTAVPTGTESEHWAAAQTFVGRPYVAGQYDCAHLLADVQAQVFGRNVPLPAVHRQGRAGRAAQIRACRDQLARRIDAPEHGCAVLMVSGAERWHIGTVFMHQQTAWVLHGSAVMASACLNRLDSFAARGLRIEGFYAWQA